MKNMKKILALVISALLVLSSFAALAVEEPTYKITVTNTNENVTIAGKTYNAYKLFDATYSGTNVSYSISTSNPFYTTSGAKAELDKYFTFTASANDSTKMVVTLKNGPDSTGKTPDQDGYVVTPIFNDAKARELADALEKNLPTDNNGQATVPAGAETVDIPLSGAGYYLVYGTADNKNGKDGDKEVVAALALTTAKPTATVNPKVDAPKLDKKMTKVEEGSATVDGAILDTNGKAAVAKVGSQVSYQLDSAVPDLTGFTKYTYIMHDAISEGLTYDKSSFVLTIGTATVSINPVFAEGDKSFTLTIPFNTLKEYAKGTAIKLTYKATVNESALTYDFENNTAYLTYSHSPYDDDTNDTPEKKTYVIDLNLDLIKVDATNTTKMLDGAEFKLYKGDGTGDTYYKWDETNGKVTWVAKDASDTFVTDTTGHFTTKIRGLDKGTYSLLETKAPEGYNLLASAITVVINVEENDAGDTVTYSATFGGEAAAMANEQVNIAAAAHNADKQPLATGTIGNNSGAELPSTGGIGTTIFYIAGSLLAIGAVILLITKRRMNANND